MNALAQACLVGLFCLASCQATGDSTPAPEPRDEAKRAELMDAMRRLEGRWEMVGSPGAIIEFSSTAKGTAIRETMFPGAEEEMVNMYTLEGNTLRMTHYCAAGNQPVMAASGLTGNDLVFASIGVQDLESPDAHYMSDMTITFVDDNHIRESWQGMAGGEVSEMPVFELKRLP